MKGEETPLPKNPCDMDSFYLGDRLIEPGLNRISRGDKAVQIEPRIMHVLACLAGRPGRVVSRADLLDAVWTKVLVNEEALTHAVSQLRRALDDDPKSPRFIETIHKTGYRLIAPVRPATAGSETVMEADTAGGKPGKHPGPITRRLGAILGAGAAIIAAIVAMTVLPGLRSSTPPAPVPLVNTPLTSYPGREICPAISPDGSRVIFSWKETDEGNYDLFMKQRNTETPLRLTETEGNEYYAVWSPDGTEFAYIFRSDEESGIYAMPALGGAPRKVIDAPYGIAGIDWAPDGRLLAYSSKEDVGQPLTIYLWSFSTGEKRILASPAKATRGDYHPVFSPDGRQIAFVRGDRIGLQDIFIIPVEGGEPERLTYSQHYIAGLDWAADGEALIFSSGPSRAADLRLWRLSVADRSLTWLPTTTQRPVRPSSALKGRGLVYEEHLIDSNILRVPVGGEAEDAVPIIASTRHDYGPQYSTGGNLIGFISTRTGSPQVWVCDKDGGGPRQLTRFENAYIENPCWSHDERYVAFSAATGNNIDIYIADVRTGEVDRLTTSSRHEKCLGWSRDGEWLYCKSDRDDAWWVWKMRADGSESVDIMAKDVFRLAESVDGEHLVYSRADTSGVWSVSLDGKDERCIVNEPGVVVPCGWRETEKGVYFFNMEGRDLSLWLEDAETGESTKLASGGTFFAVNLDVSPSGDAVIFDSQEPLGTDLALVEDF